MDQPIIKLRIVLWSFLAIILFLGASVFCFIVLNSSGSHHQAWFWGGFVFSTLGTLAITAFIVAIIIRIVEFFNRKAQRRIELGDTFE